MIHWVRIKLLIKSRFSIPWCRSKCLPLVQPISKVDVARLQNEFVMGYRNDDSGMFVFDDIRASRSSLWWEANEEFDSMLQNDSDLAHLVGKMFYVWKGNHRLTVWWRHINKHHSMDKDWHISVDCIVVDLRNYNAVFLNTMNDINWWVFIFLVFLYPFCFLCYSSFFSLLLIFCRSLEHDHVQDNHPAKLLRSRTFGKIKLEEFKDLISVAD